MTRIQSREPLCVDRCKKCGATEEREQGNGVELFIGRYYLECRECHAVGVQDDIADYARLCPVCRERLPERGSDEEPILELDVNNNMGDQRWLFGYSKVTVHARCVGGVGAVLVERQTEVLEAAEERGHGFFGAATDWCKDRLRELRRDTTSGGQNGAS